MIADLDGHGGDRLFIEAKGSTEPLKKELFFQIDDAVSLFDLFDELHDLHALIVRELTERLNARLQIKGGRRGGLETSGEVGPVLVLEPEGDEEIKDSMGFLSVKLTVCEGEGGEDVNERFELLSLHDERS